MVLQCPRCVLRFDLAPMLADHLRTDHDLSFEETVHLQPPSGRVGQDGASGRAPERRPATGSDSTAEGS